MPCGHRGVSAELAMTSLHDNGRQEAPHLTSALSALVVKSWLLRCAWYARLSASHALPT